MPERIPSRVGARALLLSYSEIANDPRVRRQVDWLTGDGWIVDTVGFGAHPTAEVRDHFVLAAPSRWTTSKAGTLATHFLLSHRRLFRLQIVNRIPAVAMQRLRAGEYDLIVFNETEFTPIISDAREFAAANPATHVHVDLHEFHRPDRRRGTLGARLTSSHYRWVRNHIGDRRIDSRSVVNDPIGRLYVEEFGVPPLTPIRNAPSKADLRPQPTSGVIRLLFHGLASWQRGFSEILDAMRALPERFTMTFMLMPNKHVIDRLSALIAEHPARDRIRIVPPAPVRDIAERINEYDLEIIFYRPLSRNLEFALPNKFFEAVQGRIGVVVGESPAMADIVREYGNGIVVPGFEASDLSSALESLEADSVGRIKRAAHDAAEILNAEVEGRAFLDAISAAKEAAR
jgi:glycosyltransferase involved in cell wall biosynthesis